MVKKALVLGILLTLSAVASAQATGRSMNDSIIGQRDRKSVGTVRCLNSDVQEIDEDSDEEKSSKTAKIKAKQSVKTGEKPEGFVSWVVRKFLSIFGY